MVREMWAVGWAGEILSVGNEAEPQKTGVCKSVGAEVWRDFKEYYIGRDRDEVLGEGGE